MLMELEEYMRLQLLLLLYEQLFIDANEMRPRIGGKAIQPPDEPFSIHNAFRNSQSFDAVIVL